MQAQANICGFVCPNAEVRMASTALSTSAVPPLRHSRSSSSGSRLRSALLGQSLCSSSSGGQVWGCCRRRELKLLVIAHLGGAPGPEQVDSALNLLGQAPDSVHHALSRMEGWLYTLADAAVATDAAVDNAVSTTTQQQKDWLSGITDAMEFVLKILKDILSTLKVPYAYGFAIIMLTVLVKAATLPLTKAQVESTISMQNLQPKIKAIQERYKGNQERIQMETARLYKQAGVNPLAGCLPTLATIPVWIGLYRALSNVANEGLLSEGFFWIPSLAGPTTIASRQSGSGISWLFPFVDGQPPLGWGDTIAYLVLPVLLVVSQFVSMQLMQPPQTDPSQKNTQLILKFLPLMIGYFALSVPSGLSLYWLTNNILSTGQQVWLRKLGGAKPMVDSSGGDIITAGRAKRSSGKVSSSTVDTLPVPEKSLPSSEKNRRGEKFKQLKAAEIRRKAEQAERERQASQAAGTTQEVEQQGAGTATQNESEVTTDEEPEDEEIDAAAAAANKKQMYATNGAGTGSTPSKSKRSKRRRSL